MTGTTHALVGAALGVLLRRPREAFVAGVVSHAVLDLVPHRDYAHRGAALVLDGFGAGAVMAAALLAGRADALLGALGGIAPDLEHALPVGNPHPRPALFPSHRSDHGASSPALGIAAELLAAAAALYLLRRLQFVRTLPPGRGR